MVGTRDAVTDPIEFPCWCGDSRWLPVFRTTRFGLMRCSECGVLRIDPPPMLNDAESSAFYTNYYAQSHKSGAHGPVSKARASRFWRVSARVPELEHVEQRVVDVGCGEGGLCAELQASGWSSVIGVDVSSTRIAC